MNLTPGKQYVVSLWVKQGNIPTNTTLAYTVQVEIDFGTAGTQVFVPEGLIIEGWQRVYGVFTVPQGSGDFNIRIRNNSALQLWYDDIRIHPFNSTMVSYVYNYKTLKLEAQLDDENYAGFYIYDQEGMLNKIKKETRKGIQTIQEGRRSTHKH